MTPQEIFHNQQLYSAGATPTEGETKLLKAGVHVYNELKSSAATEPLRYVLFSFFFEYSIPRLYSTNKLFSLFRFAEVKRGSSWRL